MARDEARNVAIVLVDAQGRAGGVKSAPLSQISSRLQEQGILDAVIEGIRRQFDAEERPRFDTLLTWHKSLQHSLLLTEPQPTAIYDPEATLSALYKAFVAPRPAQSSGLTKGSALDRVVEALRKRGRKVGRGQYLDDFLFDVVFEDHTPGSVPSVMEVISFGMDRKDWTTVEYDAGHFILACEKTGASGTMVVAPPIESTVESSSASYERIKRWCELDGIEIVPFRNVISPQAALYA